MFSFRDARLVLLLALDSGHITDDEFIALYEDNTSKNPDFPYQEYDQFNLEDRGRV